MTVSELKRAGRVAAFVIYSKGLEMARVNTRPDESPDRARNRAEIVRLALQFEDRL